jgi:hypothetical protein
MFSAVSTRPSMFGVGPLPGDAGGDLIFAPPPTCRLFGPHQHTGQGPEEKLSYRGQELIMTSSIGFSSQWGCNGFTLADWTGGGHLARM